MDRTDVGWGDENTMHETSRSGRRGSRAWMLTGAAAGVLMAGALIMPATAAAEGEAVVAASVTAPSVFASANCVGTDSWSATWVVSSNAGNGGTWQMNGGTFQSTAADFVVEETHSLDESSAAFAATVSYDGGAQARPVSSSVDRPASCISAPPPPAPAPQVETASQLNEGTTVVTETPAPTVASSSNCSGSDAWTATYVISSNAGDSGSWQLNDGAFQSTATAFVVEKTYSINEASASFAAAVSFEGGAQGVPVAATAARPSACISAPPPSQPPAETVPVVEVFAPAAVASPSAVASPTPDLAQELPATGNETTILALLALTSLGAGMILVRASRRRTDIETT